MNHLVVTLYVHAVLFAVPAIALYSSNRSKPRLQPERTSAMARNSKTRQTPIHGTAPNLAPNPVTGGPAHNGDAIFEERNESLAPPSLQTTGENKANPTIPSATLAAAQFENLASTASTLSPVPDDPEFDKDSDIQTVLPGHDNQANTTVTTHRSLGLYDLGIQRQLPPHRIPYPIPRLIKTLRL
ncbi:hypothetical protein V8E54_003621 [Elaphomyces granulatus]